MSSVPRIGLAIAIESRRGDGVDGTIFVFKNSATDVHTAITYVVRLLFSIRSYPFTRQAPQSMTSALGASEMCETTERNVSSDDTAEEADHIFGPLLIRVIDLNANAAKREAIIAQNPPQLAAEQDAVALLRTRVLINIYEKFNIGILDAGAAACLRYAGAAADDN